MDQFLRKLMKLPESQRLRIVEWLLQRVKEESKQVSEYDQEK